MPNLKHVYPAIGERIREARKKKYMTQARLAELVSMTRTSITNIEKGRQKLLVHTLYNLANALGVHPEDLLPAERKHHLERTLVERLPKDLSRREKDWVKLIIRGGDNLGTSKKND